MRIGSKDFQIGDKTYVMGILNVTPDSFSDGGKYNGLETAMHHAKYMIDAGVDIIDVGGESTRPGYTKISDEEEIKRVVPVIQMLKAKYDIPISVDTYKSHVAKAAIDEGADLINDIWGLKYDSNMAGVIAEGKAACCLMHNRETKDYSDFMADVKNDLKESIHLAKEAGIADDKIILDPGVGFAKTYEMNLEIIKNLKEFHTFPYPILLGTSRKSVIGRKLNLPADQREEGTLVTTTMAVLSGCSFVRVHDVQGNKRAILMAEEIIKNHDLSRK